MAWEYSFLNFIQQYLSSDLMDSIMIFITTLTNGGTLWIIAALLLIIFPKYRRWGLCLAAVLIIGTLINSGLLKPLIARPRPFVGIENLHLLIPPPTDASFPSGHTLASLSSAIVIFAADKRIGIPAVILAVLTAFSRMYLYVHFPTDILAGALLAVVISSLSIFVTKKLGAR